MKNALPLRHAALCLLFTCGSFANAADLRTVYREARKYDATFAAAEAQYRAGLEKAAQGQALLRPTVTLDAEYAHSNRDSEPGGNRTGNTYGYTVTATQPLYRVSASAGNAQLQEQAKLAEVTFRIAQQDLILRVAQAYFDVLLAEDTLAFVVAQKEATAQQLAQARKNFEVGNATITDTHEAQARYDAIAASEIAASNDLAVKKNAFLQIAGVPGEGLNPLAIYMKAQPPQPDDLNTWLQRAEDANLQIAARRGALAIAVAEIDKFRALNQPTLDMFARYVDSRLSGETTVQNTADRTQTGSIGVNLKIPLYTGGNTSSRLREALALREQAQFDLEATRRNAAQTTQQAYLGVKSGAAQIRALEQALVSSQSVLDSTRLGKEVGVRTNLDLLNAQQQYFSTRRDLASARYAYLLNRLKLQQATGQLNDRELDAVNADLRR